MTVTAAVLAINIGSRSVQRRAAVVSTDSTPGCEHRRHRAAPGIDPNVLAGANLDQRIPVAVYVRFAARAATGNDPVRAAVIALYDRHHTA